MNAHLNPTLNMDVKAKVIKKFNDELGFALKNFEDIEEIHKKLESDRNKVAESLSFVSSEAPSKIKEAVEEVNEVISCMDEIKHSCKTISLNIEKRLEQENETSDLQNIIEDISCLEKASLYLQIVKFIEDLSSELELSLQSGNDEACLASYVILKESCQNLNSSCCLNLKIYANETLCFWYNEIKKKLMEDYDEVLKNIKWPFCKENSNVVNTPVSQEFITKFKIITEHLFYLQLPDFIIEEILSKTLSKFSPPCLPIALLVRPLRARFLFHFSGEKKTNRQDKPEWYFTQILTWIKDHSDWVDKMVQPIANSVEYTKCEILIEFMRAMVELAVEKLNSELPDYQYDDALFAHTVDEALGFERELRETLLYPTSEPATVYVLTQAPIFTKWITMEKKYATEKMDAILSSESAWTISPGFESDNMKVTECAEYFLILLNKISDRYLHLPEPSHRLQFLDLQLELIDDWRIRLLQLLHEDCSDPLLTLKPRILNTLHYVINDLQDLGVTIPFLQLYFFKKQLEDAEKSMYEELDSQVSGEENINLTVFDEAISLMQRLEKKVMIEIGDFVFMEIKSMSRSYCNDRWFSMPSEKEVIFSVTPSACQMFQAIVNRLHELHMALAEPLFEQWWIALASRLDHFLLEELILRNQFNNGGAAQLQFDIKRNLFAVFGLYTKKPELHFPLVKEALILLNMLLGSAMLLVETLENDEENITKVLDDVNIYQLSPSNVLKILKTRMDISTK